MFPARSRGKRRKLQCNILRFIPILCVSLFPANMCHSLLPSPAEPQKIYGTTKSKGQASLAPSRPLGDKTPFPNRVHNHATPFQVTKPVFDVTPGALLRPSSARKHIRLPHSASKSFQTPVTGGNHWDVSDIEINPEVVAEPNQSIEEEDYDEIEYMPPKQPGQLFVTRFFFGLTNVAQNCHTNLHLSYQIITKSGKLFSLLHTPTLSMMCLCMLHRKNSQCPYLTTSSSLQMAYLSLILVGYFHTTLILICSYVAYNQTTIAHLRTSALRRSLSPK